MWIFSRVLLRGEKEVTARLSSCSLVACPPLLLLISTTLSSIARWGHWRVYFTFNCQCNTRNRKHFDQNQYNTIKKYKKQSFKTIEKLTGISPMHRKITTSCFLCCLFSSPLCYKSFICPNKISLLFGFKSKLVHYSIYDWPSADAGDCQMSDHLFRNLNIRRWKVENGPHFLLWRQSRRRLMSFTGRKAATVLSRHFSLNIVK